MRRGWCGLENERRTRTRSYDWMRARYESTRYVSDLGTLLPERADATEVAAAPRKERKETFNACGGGQPKNEGGGRKG